MPELTINDIIRIGDDYRGPKAQVVYIYNNEDKSRGFCGDLEVVYYQNRIKGIKEDVVWNGGFWEFKNKGPSGSYVDIDNYPELKK